MLVPLAMVTFCSSASALLGNASSRCESVTGAGATTPMPVSGSTKDGDDDVEAMDDVRLVLVEINSATSRQVRSTLGCCDERS